MGGKNASLGEMIGALKLGKAIRNLFKASEFPDEIARDIKDAYKVLCKRYDRETANVAVSWWRRE